MTAPKLLVVGSVAIDSIETPFGKEENSIGGSALYFSAAASIFTPVSLVGVVGEDFPHDKIRFLEARGVDLSGIEVAPGETFRWVGRYGFDLNEAHTLDTRLNVFETFSPTLTEAQRDAEFLFLANIDPELQLNVLGQVRNPKLTAVDTMNFWIESKRDALLKVIERVDLIVLNDAEARMLAEESNLVKAASKILSWGPTHVVVKQGEYGVVHFSSHHVFSAPAYPLEEVFDPTGAGDSFAGGMMGALAAGGRLDGEALKRALVYGSAVASYNVEDFSFRRMIPLTKEDLQRRFLEFRRMTAFETDF